MLDGQSTTQTLKVLDHTSNDEVLAKQHRTFYDKWNTSI